MRVIRTGRRAGGAVIGLVETEGGGAREMVRRLMKTALDARGGLGAVERVRVEERVVVTVLPFMFFG